MDDKKSEEVVDGSNIVELVENQELFTKFVDHKFSDLDKDRDGRLSLRELHPAVADIGAALGLPPQGSSPDSDYIYSEVLSEFTHGKQDKVTKSEFKEVLSDILLGMAAGLKRDPVVILRIDGEDLSEFVLGPSFEPEMASIFSEIESENPHLSLKDSILKALEKLTVEQGMPPMSDPWVMSNIVDPAIGAADDGEKPASREALIAEFRKTAENVARRLGEQPVIVAHSESTFDGSGIRRLFSNKFEFEKTLSEAMESLPRDRTGKISREHLPAALDLLAPATGLPPLGAVDEMSEIVAGAARMVRATADDGGAVREEDFRKMLSEMLGSIMLQLEGAPISVSSNSVVHEPLSSASTLLQPPPQ